ncbi:MAG: transposase [Anaerolineales bacterium]
MRRSLGQFWITGNLMMVYDPTNLRRRSIRLKGLDYAAAGGYYVTIVAQWRESFFGEIRNAELIPNDAGNMINKIWLSLSERFPKIEVDTFQLMPNHFHGILMVHDVGATLVVAPDLLIAPDRAGTRPAPTIGKMIGAFKSITTHEYILGVNAHGWVPFNQRFWQRNYYEHIIRNQAAHERIANYIFSNPANWGDDEENLHNIPPKEN